MERKQLIIKKIVASMLVFVIMVTHSAIVGITAVSYAIDMIATNSNNVQFKAYFESNGEETSQIESSIDEKELKLNIDVAVKNEGYLNGQISLVNSGFKIKEQHENEYIDKIENDVIYLKQINADETAKIELGIEAISELEINSQTLNSVTEVMLTGTYYNSRKDVEINGKSEVNVIWNIPQETKAQLSTQLLTNSIYKVREERKRVVQFLVSSKATNNSYPVKNTKINITVPEDVEKVEVHKRTTNATNGNKEFTEGNYNVENNILTINVENTETDGNISWTKNSKDIYVVTYEFAENTEVSDKNIIVNSSLTMYDTNETILGSEERQIKLDEEKQGIITIDKKENEQEIYKGKIYSKEGRYYTTYTRIYVDYADAVQGLNISENEASYIIEDENLQANIQYKQLKINKQNLEAILGLEWKLVVTDENNNKKEITNETEIDESGNIVVTVNKDSKTLNIKTSKVQTNGILQIETTKKILDAGYERQDLNQITSIQNSTSLEYKDNDDETYNINKKSSINLKETESYASLKCEQQALIASDETQELHITVVLDSDSEAKDLYKNPELKINFPEQVSLENAQAKILYANGLEIKSENFKISKEGKRSVITLLLEGEQETYLAEGNQGATVLIKAKVKTNKIDKNATEEIILNYTNENATKYSDNGEQKVQLEFIPAVEEVQNVSLEATRNVQSTTSVQPVRSNSDEEELSLDLTASVGGQAIQEGETVKAGEIITYTARITNNSEQRVENATLIATIPENTTLIRVNPEFLVDVDEDAPTQEIEESEAEILYFIPKNVNDLRKESISVEPNETLTYTYMIRVNSDISETIEVETKLKLQYEDKEIEKTIVSALTNANLALELYPGFKTSKEDLTSGQYYTYCLKVNNLTDEPLTNLVVTIPDNELLDLQSAMYIAGDELKNPEIAQNSFTIDSILPNEEIIIEIFTLVKQTTENTNVFSIAVTVTESDNIVYRSNQILKAVTGVKINTQLTSSVSETEYLRPNDNIKYMLNLKNVGDLDAEDLIIKYRFSDYLELQSIKLNGEDCEYTIQNEFGENVHYNTIIINLELEIGEEARIEIFATVRSSLYDENLLEVTSMADIYDGSIYITQSDEMIHHIESIVYREVEFDEDNNDEDNNNEDLNTISGTVWVDENKNGNRDAKEAFLEGIKVWLIDVATNNIVKNKDGKEISSITDNQGLYRLTDIPEGEYIVAFEYDTEKYLVTEYQAEGVSESRNSDAVKASRIVNGEEKTFAFTDSIELNESIANLDLGLVEIKKFNIELKKVVSKIIVTNKEGTKTYNFEDTDLAKVEIAAKNLSSSNVVVEYKIKVKNNGDIAGYVKNIVDHIPSSLTFNSTLNKDWYKQGKNLYNSSLSNVKIAPGEEKEITLTLTKKMTESNTGLINNKAKLQSAYSEQGIEDKDLNVGSADVIISVKTGVAKSFIAITLIVMITICGIAYVINRKQLKEEIEI